MKNITSSIFLVTFAISMTGCATTPDPAKVCTSEWIGKRADKAVSRIESKAGRSMRALSKAGNSWSKGKTPNPFQMLALSSSLKSLEKELKNGRGMRDLKTLAATCDDPKIVSDSMAGFMRKQGLPENMIEFVQKLPIYENLVNSPLEKQITQNYVVPPTPSNGKAL